MSTREIKVTLNAGKKHVTEDGLLCIDEGLDQLSDIVKPAIETDESAETTIREGFLYCCN